MGGVWSKKGFFCLNKFKFRNRCINNWQKRLVRKNKINIYYLLNYSLGYKKNLPYSTHHPFSHPSHRISINCLEGTYCSLGKSNKSCNQYTWINLFLKLTKGKKFPLTTLINTTCSDHWISRKYYCG